MDSQDLNCVRIFVLQAKQDATELQEKSKQLKQGMADLEEQEKQIIKDRDATVAVIGNVVHDSVPVSDDEVRDRTSSGVFSSLCTKARLVNKGSWVL
jgi:seryl-tRNA synthetase